MSDTSNCTLSTCPMSDAYLDYLPNVPANAFFVALFALIFCIQLFTGVWYRTWAYMGAMLPGLILEVLGYVGRLMLHHNPFNFNSFLLYLICLTIAPAFFSAAIYICLGKIITIYGTQLARFRPRTYTVIFVSCDLTSLVLQAAGGAIASIADSDQVSLQNTGVNIMIAGLAFQVASLLLFMVLATEFIFAVHKSSKEERNDEFTGLRQQLKWKMFLYCLGLATVTIFIRSTFRVAELKGGFSSALANNQVDLMVLESSMVSIACICLTAGHPAFIIGGTWSSL
ncbi:RTA1 domain protein [Penicillium malachiteum]|nr:RTA1 domain protein [Penicillium malachiteum]